MSKREIEEGEDDFEQYFENYFMVDYSTWYPYAKGYFKVVLQDDQGNIINSNVNEDKTQEVDAVLYLHKPTSRPLLIIKEKMKNETEQEVLFWVCSSPKEFDNNPNGDHFRVEARHTKEDIKDREFNNEVFYNMWHAAEKYNNSESVIDPDDLAQFMQVFILRYQSYINFEPIHEQDMNDIDDNEENRNNNNNNNNNGNKRRK